MESMGEADEGSSSSAWQSLPRDVLELIFVDSPNSIPCVARLVCRASWLALHDPKYNFIHLSKPVPPWEFARHWAGADGVRTLNREQKQRLRRLTASSGSIPNLQLLLSLLASDPTPELLAAAAGAGHMDTCAWLRQQGCPWDESGVVLMAAAGAGHLHVCRWLQQECGPFREGHLVRARTAAAGGGHAAVCDWVPTLVAHPARISRRTHLTAAAAARGGHVGLMESLLSEHPKGKRLSTVQVGDLLSAVAAGCDLPALQRAHKEWDEDAELRLRWLGRDAVRHTVVGAMCSRTPDWRGKVEWMEAAGYPCRQDIDWAAVAGTPDALERVAWLHERGCALRSIAAREAARRGDLGLLRYCYAAGVRLSGVAKAAAGGDGWPVETLRELAALGDPVAAGEVLSGAAARGDGQVVAWALAQPDVEAPTAPMMASAALSGSVEVMAQLRAGGCPLSKGAFAAAVESGCEAAVEWLAEQGCPVPSDHMGLILEAGRRGDMGVLSCLRRLGFALPTGEDTFTQALGSRWHPPMLRWLLDQGCAVDWCVARQRVAGCGEETMAWVEERYREEERQRQAGQQGR